jgi:hypothetical protein
MFIKNILREELENSERLRAGYERELAKLPKGSLVQKQINGHKYYYIIVREAKKVLFKYQGKNVEAKVIENYAEAKRLRALYRNSLSQAKRQIRYLRSALRGKETV